MRYRTHVRTPPSERVRKLHFAVTKTTNHELNEGALGFDLDDLRGCNLVLLGAGLEKAHAIEALLRSGIVRGLIIDGDAAARLAAGKIRRRSSDGRVTRPDPA